MNNISNSNGTLFYSKKGIGTKVLLAFHGYDQDHSIFESFSDSFYNDFTIYSFDIFFHGQSRWHKDEQPLTKVQWKDFISLILKKEDIDTFEVIGYSMGGKFAITTLTCFPKQCHKAYLLAPDGFVKNFWYSIPTQYSITRKLFKQVINRPNIYTGISKVAKVLRLIPPKIIDFTNSMMDTTTKRQHVYNTWMIFRLLYTSPKKFNTIINKNKNSVHVFVGDRDGIIKPTQISKMLYPVKNITIHTLNSGHGKLINETIQYIESKRIIIN